MLDIRWGWEGRASSEKWGEEEEAGEILVTFSGDAESCPEITLEILIL